MPCITLQASSRSTGSLSMVTRRRAVQGKTPSNTLFSTTLDAIPPSLLSPIYARRSSNIGSTRLSLQNSSQEVPAGAKVNEAALSFSRSRSISKGFLPPASNELLPRFPDSDLVNSLHRLLQQSACWPNTRYSNCSDIDYLAMICTGKKLVKRKKGYLSQQERGNRLTSKIDRTESSSLSAFDSAVVVPFNSLKL